MGGDVAFASPLTELFERLYLERSACTAELAAVAKEEAIARAHADKVRAEFAARLEEKVVAEKAAFDAQSRSQQAREALARAERQGTIAAAKAAQLAQIAKLSESAKLLCQIDCRSQRTVQTQVNAGEVEFDLKHRRCNCSHQSCFAAFDAPEEAGFSDTAEDAGENRRAIVVAASVDDTNAPQQQGAASREKHAASALRHAVASTAEGQRPTESKPARQAKVSKQPISTSAASTSRLIKAASVLQHHTSPFLALAVCQDARGAGCMPSTGTEGRQCSRHAGTAIEQSSSSSPSSPSSLSSPDVGESCLAVVPPVASSPRSLFLPLPATVSGRETLPGIAVEAQAWAGECRGQALKCMSPSATVLVASDVNNELHQGNAADSCTVATLATSCDRQAQDLQQPECESQQQHRHQQQQKPPKQDHRDKLGRQRRILNPCLALRRLRLWGSSLWQQRPHVLHKKVQSKPKAAGAIFAERRPFLCAASRWPPKRRSGRTVRARTSFAVQRNRATKSECTDSIAAATSRAVGYANRLLVPSRKQSKKETCFRGAGRNVWGGG